jgi:hypothetical protein
MRARLLRARERPGSLFDAKATAANIERAAAGLWEVRRAMAPGGFRAAAGASTAPGGPFPAHLVIPPRRNGGPGGGVRGILKRLRGLPAVASLSGEESRRVLFDLVAMLPEGPCEVACGGAEAQR